MGSNWDQIGSDIEGASQDGEFGYSVSINKDGTRVAVGARLHNRATGQVTIYTLGIDDDGEAEWQQMGQALNGNGIAERFGHDVSLSENGDIVACGAPEGTPNGSIAKSGVVKVYKCGKDCFLNVLVFSMSQ